MVIFAVMLPLLISPHGHDVFRFPKELAIRAAAIALVTGAALFALHRRWKPNIDPRDPVLYMAAAIATWTLVTTLTSTNKALSTTTLGWVLALMVIFIGTYLSARLRSVHAAAILLVPAVINAAVVLLQSSRIWQPFAFAEVEERATRTGLLGNPRDVAAYIVVPALIAVALAIVHQGQYRIAYAACAVLLALPVFVTLGLAGLAAYGIGCLAIALLAAAPRWRFTVLAVTAAALAAIVLASPPLRQRVRTTFDMARQGNVDTALSNRGTAFLAAWQMGIDHPLTGVGPGTFAWQYYDYKLAVERKHPQLLQSPTRHLNFGEAHNDHLQTFAVAGIPGYLLFLGAALMLAAPSLRSRSAAEGDDFRRQEFARLASLPIAVAILVNAIGFFPLELAASVGTYIVAAGICLAWRYQS